MKDYISITERLLAATKELSSFRFFLWCLSSATKEETTVIARGHPVTLLRGQFIYSRRRAYASLACKGVTERKVRTALTKCMDAGLLSHSTSQQVSVISVVDFDEYTACVPVTVPAGVPVKAKRSKKSSGQGEKGSITSTTKKKSKSKKNIDLHKDKHDDINKVVQHYRITFPAFGRTISPGHPSWNLIGDRIAEGYTVQDCVSAINGNANDPWWSERSLHSVKNVFRETSNMDKFIVGWSSRSNRSPVISTKSQRSMSAARSWLERGDSSDE